MLWLSGAGTDHVLDSREDLSKDNLALSVRELSLSCDLAVELSSPCVLHHQV